MGNIIDLYSIGDLLDGRFFYIPAYQRGYRWTEKQVGDLLRDLLCFANDQAEKTDKVDDFGFYCLQPIIARPITDKNRIGKLFGEANKDLVSEKGAWEIIDGQQRLTTIFLIYRYLMKQMGYTAEMLKEEEDGKEEYHICYATRENSEVFLQNLSLDSLAVSSEEMLGNIDYFHMGTAFKYIDSWIKTDGRVINKRYNLDGSLREVRNTLFALLNASRNNKKGSVQVLWYQIEDSSQSSIKEFQRINTGKIKLTDAELIKGLFLLDKNFSGGDKIRMSELAFDWEFIENTLHKDSFWYFLQMRGTDFPNRIDLLFQMLYKIQRLKSFTEDEWPAQLRIIDNELKDTSKSAIFRFYYDRFEGKFDKDLHLAVKNAWEEVMTLFRMLDDWFSTPNVYNYIGLLSQCGEDLSILILHYFNMPEESSQADFINYLIERIRWHLRGTRIDFGNHKILNRYNREPKLIFNLLLTLNIHILNLQNSKWESQSDIYKFPFDVLNEQGWDIEHIDSFHTNSLKREEDKIKWIDIALDDLKGLANEEREIILSLKAARKYDDAIHILKMAANEAEVGEDIKNSIGNLTLLDSSTNRLYGNSLFCTKRRIIIQRMEKGIFVPIGTQYIFYKFFDTSGTNRSQWNQEDMDKYQDYIFEKLESYLPKEGVKND